MTAYVPSLTSIYLYGFASPSHAMLDLACEGVEPGVPVEVIHASGIAALISHVPAHVYAAKALESRMEDVAWLVARSERHHEVLRLASNLGTVAPCRFATLYRDRSGVEAILRRHRDPLRSLFVRLEGRSEWSIKVYGSRNARGGANTSSQVPESGTEYMLRRSRERSDQRSSVARDQRQVEEIVQRVAEFAESLVMLPLRDLRPLATPSTESLWLNLACLIPRRDESSWNETLERLTEESRPGLQLVRNGPLPPYSFTGDLPTQ